MTNKPLINILTRTSNRPNYFKSCIENIRSQTYTNIRHIVSVDNDETEQYVKGYNVEYIRVNYDGEYEKPKESFRYIAPYNLYLNDMVDMVTDGWIMFLDDDDIFISNTVIDEIVNIINNNNIEEDNMLLWKVKFPNNLLIPEQVYFNRKQITPCHITMSGFMYHHTQGRDVKFDEYSMGDYYYIKKLEGKIPKSTWIPKVFTTLQRKHGMGGLGKRDDKSI